MSTLGGNKIIGETETIRIPLLAKTKEEAIVEAKVLWNEKITEAKARWAQQKKTWTNPPASAFEYGPCNPKVVCEIPLMM
jgi:hypothetical protein